jgi:hypothetical protein
MDANSAYFKDAYPVQLVFRFATRAALLPEWVKKAPTPFFRRDTTMLDVFAIIAFTVFGILLVVAVLIVVTLRQLPGQIAQQRGHPQAAAMTVTSWLGRATLGLLWPLALIGAFLKPFPAVSSGSAGRLTRPSIAACRRATVHTRIVAAMAKTG